MFKKTPTKKPLSKEEVKRRQVENDKHNKAVVDSILGAREDDEIKSKKELIKIARINRENFRLSKEKH